MKNQGATGIGILDMARGWLVSPATGSKKKKNGTSYILSSECTFDWIQGNLEFLYVSIQLNTTAEAKKSITSVVITVVVSNFQHCPPLLTQYNLYKFSQSSSTVAVVVNIAGLLYHIYYFPDSVPWITTDSYQKSRKSLLSLCQTDQEAGHQWSLRT